MTLKLALVLAVIGLPSACGRRSSERDTADTVMVFEAAPPSTLRGSASDSARRIMLAALSAYSVKRISADSAARVVVDYLDAQYSVNAAFDSELVNAIKREQRRRHGH